MRNGWRKVVVAAQRSGGRGVEAWFKKKKKNLLEFSVFHYIIFH
jgi:hypothetical protein